MNHTLRQYYERSAWEGSVFCWYPFEEGAGCKAVIDPQDFSVEALRLLRESLGEHGRLLLAYENPFGLRYWSGKQAPDTGLPYDTLYGQSHLPSRAELSHRLERAGFGGQKWYYPLTDHWFTREVYSEDYLPGAGLIQRFAPYMADHVSLQFDERPLYREMIRGGAFEFLCGAYLVEARVCGEDAPCAVDYAAVTAYREPEKRFATTVRSDGSVHKTPLHPDGVIGVENTLRNHRELAALGVPVIELKREGNALVMPRLSLPTLWDDWAEGLERGTFDEDKMFSQFDRIREAIYRAAKGGKCFWELVPANCFYNREKDELLFFDQEYCWEGVEPDVAVARAVCALRYSPTLAADPRSEVWLETLKERYALTDRWEELLALADAKTFSEVFGEGSAALDEESDRAERRIEVNRRDDWMVPVAERLKELGYLLPAIYGYGARGKVLWRALEKNGFAVAAILDQTLCTNRPMEETLAESGCDVLIVSIKKDADAIANELRGRVSVPIYTLGELLNEQAE